MADVDIVFNVKDGGAAQKIDNISRSMTNASSVAGAGAKAFTGMFGSILAGNVVSQIVTKSLTAMKDALFSVVESAMESQRVSAQLEAVLKSTGNAVGLTKDQLLGLAKGLQASTTFSDEAIVGAENLLLTFTNIGKNIFPQATETILDMSTALGQDLKSSAIQVGKALQDPILGVTALRRVGVNFNEAQMETIKRLVETGRAMEAQKLILKELKTEFGGSAAAAANTFGGRMTQIKNQIDELKETIGNFLIQSEELTLAFEGIAVAVRDLVGWLGAQKGGLMGMLDKLAPGMAVTIRMLELFALKERKRQKQIEDGKKVAEEWAKGIADGSLKLNIFGVDVLAAGKNIWNGLTKPAGAAGAAVMSLEEITDKFKIKTKTELTSALKEARAALDTYRQSTEATPEGVKTLTKTINELKEALYGKKEKTIFDAIFEARKNPKFLEPIALKQMVIDTPLINSEFLNPKRHKIIENAVKAMSPPPKLKFDWKGVAEDISRFWQEGIAEMIAGTSSFRDFVANSFKMLASGVGSAIGKLAGNALKGLGAIAGPIGSMIGGLATAAITGLGKLFGIKSKAEKEKERAAKAEAELKKATDATIRSMKSLGDVSEATAKSIVEAAKTMGKARAEAKYLDAIIKDVGVTASNLNQLWQRAIGVLRDTKKGTIPAKEGIASLNDAFESLISGAKDLGREYGRNVARFMIEMRESGLKVGSAFAYMRDQLSAIPDALNTLSTSAAVSKDQLQGLGDMAEAAFAAMTGSGSDFAASILAMRDAVVALKNKYAEMGETADASLQTLFKVSDIAAANKDLFEAISANQKILESLGNSGWLTADAMNAMTANATSFYDKLQTAGMTSNEALRTIAPTLQRIYDYAKAYGLQIDANTQSLIDQAKASGLISESENATAAAIDRVMKGFGDRMETIMDNLARRLEMAFGVGGGGYRPSNMPPRGYASGGIAWYPQTARVAEKEPEAVIPLSKIAAAIAESGRPGALRSGPTIFNLRINGATLARLIAPDLETLQRNGRYRSDIAAVIRNET